MMIDDLLRIPECEVRPAEAMQASLCYTLVIRGRMLQTLSFVPSRWARWPGLSLYKKWRFQFGLRGYPCLCLLEFGYGTGNWDDLAVLIIVHTTTTCNVCILNDLATSWTASGLRVLYITATMGVFFFADTRIFPLHSPPARLLHCFPATCSSFLLHLSRSLPLSCCLPLAGAPLPSPHFLYLCYFSPYTPGLSLQSDSLLSPPLSPSFFPGSSPIWLLPRHDFI